MVLFDEIEKAHPDVFNILLQVLDDGRLTDNKGRVTDFKNTIIIMTSNLGSNIIEENYDKGLMNHADMEDVTKEEVMALLRKTIRPEFLNRIDEILMFKQLSKAEIHQIVLMQLNNLKEKLEKNDLKVRFTDDAIEGLADMGYDPHYGARPLKRVIQNNVMNNLSKLLLSNSLDKNKTIVVDLIDSQFVAYQDDQEKK